MRVCPSAKKPFSSFFFCFFRRSALSECTDLPLLLNPPTLISQAQSYASNGQIDGLGNVTRQSWYLYSGQADQTVATAVVKSIETVMQALGTPAANFAHEYSINAGHGVPTLTYGVSCSASQSPFINNCNYDGAGAIFKQLYGAGLKARGTQNSANWRTLNTYDFTPSGWDDNSLSLGDNVHIYVPTACANKAKCRLHFVFHGCAQSDQALGSVFYQNTGYAEWAETNNIVVAFPQAAPNPLLSNPEGCFDWWGYTNADYANRNGPQIQTFKAIGRFLGARMV